MLDQVPMDVSIMATSLITRSANTLESLTRRGRLKIGIDLQGQDAGFVASYTTRDRIEGEVTVEADYDTRFDSVEITFEGTSRTSIERPAPGHPSHQPTAHHTFLRLRQPIDENSYPEPRIFQPRRRYRFPFTFVVPEQLLPQSCTHSTCNLHLRHAHTQLPPSLGDPMLASDGANLLDDMAPLMTQISYLIRVCVKRIPAVGSKPRVLTAIAKKVRIIPASLEQPPLEVTNKSDDYCLRKEKDVRRGLLRGKMGRLVVAASQPKPLQLAPPGPDPFNASSAVTVHLRFDPDKNCDELPPRLGTLCSKLRVSTFFATTPWTEFPSKSPALAWSAARGVYSETLSLSSLCVASAQWERHWKEDDSTRRDSSHSISSIETITGPSASYSGNAYYTAAIIVPVSLPKGKAFVPTFHSCLTSRVYTLDLSLSYHTPNANVIAPSVSLKIPIQITSGVRKNHNIDLLSDMTISQMEVEEEFFRPRSIIRPSIDRPGRLLNTAYPPRRHHDDESYLEMVSLLSAPAGDRYSYYHADSPSRSPSMSFDARPTHPPEYSVLPQRVVPVTAQRTGSSAISDIPADQTIRIGSC